MTEPDDALRSAVQERVMDAIAAAYPVAQHFAQPGDDVGLAACVSVLGMLVSITEIRYGAMGVDALVEALADIAPVAKQSGQQFREGLN